MNLSFAKTGYYIRNEDLDNQKMSTGDDAPDCGTKMARMTVRHKD